MSIFNACLISLISALGVTFISSESSILDGMDFRVVILLMFCIFIASTSSILWWSMKNAQEHYKDTTLMRNLLATQIYPSLLTFVFRTSSMCWVALAAVAMVFTFHDSSLSRTTILSLIFFTTFSTVLQLYFWNVFIYIKGRLQGEHG